MTDTNPISEAITVVPAEGLDAHRYALHLATALRERLFPDNTGWRPFDTLLGLLTQIDNMTTAIAPPVGARVTVKPGEIERAVWSAMIWAASNNAGFNGVPEYTDRGNSFAEDEARRAAARILSALLPAGEGE